MLNNMPNAILDNIDNYSIIVSNLQGEITYFNRGAEKIFGYTSKEMLGKSPVILYPSVNMAELQDDLAKIMKGIDYIGVWEGRTKSGDKVILDIKTTLLEEGGATTGFIGFAKDITAEEEMKIKLKEKAEQINTDLENKVNFKSEFIAQMSHEIRTPLNGIIGILDVFELTTELTEKQAELLEVMKFSSKDLLKIVNDILDLSKLEAGKLKLSFSKENINNLLNINSKIFQAKAAEKGLNLTVKCAKTEDEIFIDKTRYGQVIKNILSNAIKFTEQGAVTVFCEIIKESTQDITFKTGVTDTGTGISPEDMEKLFGKYIQLENADEKVKNGTEYGTGLGLNISQNLVKLMGGEINVKSELGQGTTFYFTSTFKKVNTEKQKSVDAIKEKKHFLKGKSILLVEDKFINQKVATLMLKSLKADVKICENGFFAVEELKHNSYDIILMDIQMPIMDGIEATQIIKNELKLDTPIIALTATNLEDNIEEYSKIGIEGFLSKPISIEAINNELIKFI